MKIGPFTMPLVGKRTKRGCPVRLLATFTPEPLSRTEVAISPDIDSSRYTCPVCGSSWPVMAPELECSCPPNAGEWPRGESKIRAC